MATVNLTTTSSNFAQAVVDAVRAEVIAGLRAGLAHLPPGVVVPAVHQKGNTLTARYTRFNDLAEPAGGDALAGPDAYLLVEGTPPAAQALGESFDTLLLKQYGGLVDFSDLMDAEHPADIGKTFSERVSRQMKAVLDGIAKAVWHGSAASFVVTSTTIIKGDDVRKMVALLSNAGVPRVGGGNIDGTSEGGEGGYYVGIISPMAAYDLKAETTAGGWLDVARYANPESILSGEIGAFAGVRFVESPKGRIDVAATPDTFKTIIAGANSIAFGDLGTMFLSYLPAGVATKDDPLAQKGEAGWKMLAGGAQVKLGQTTRFGTISSTSTLVP